MTLQRVVFALLVLFAFTLPWEKSLALPGVGTIARAAGVAAFIAGTAYLVWTRRFRRLNLAILLMAAFVLWSALTWFWSFDRSATIARTVTFAQLLAMVWLTWNLCRTAQHQRLLAGALIAGAAVASLATIARYAANMQTYYRRYAAAGFDPNDLGLTVALLLPLCLWTMTHGRRWLALSLISGALCSWAILLTASRTALICAFLSFLCLAANWKGSPKFARFAGLAIVVLLLLGTFLLAPKESRQRIATVVKETTTGTLHKRTTIWKAGVSAWKSRKWTGVGSGAYPDAVRPIIGVPGIAGHEYVAHNTHLSVLVETGLIGFAFYGALLLTLVTSVVAMPCRERALWATVLVVWCVGVSTLTWEHRKIAWFLFALLLTEWSRAWRAEPERRL